jgi:hypothetical protein
MPPHTQSAADVAERYVAVPPLEYAGYGAGGRRPSRPRRLNPEFRAQPASGRHDSDMSAAPPNSFSRVDNAVLRSSPDGFVTIELEVVAAPGQSPPDLVKVRLIVHDDVAVYALIDVNCRAEGGVWRGKHQWHPSGSRRLIELRAPTPPTDHPIDLAPGMIFLEPTVSGTWDSGDRAIAERDRLQRIRDARFAVSIGRNRDSAILFTVVMLADNLKLSGNQRVPGLQLLPITDTSLGADVVTALNSVLGQLGFVTGVHPVQWIRMMQEQRPAAILYAPKVWATSVDEARLESRHVAQQLLDLVALRRGATPRLLAGVVGTTDANGRICCRGSWTEGTVYTGNLLSGFLSGEDPHSLLHQWDGLTSDPRARLWISLYADALSDERWEYRLFRRFNLLEGISSQIVPKSQHVVDDNGHVLLQANGKPYTTGQARGKVFELLRHVASAMHEAQTNYTARRDSGPPPTLWEDVGVWVTIRNAVAHRGSWELPDGSPRSPAEAATAADIASRGHDGTFGAGVSRLISAIDAASKSTLIVAMRGQF